jgi:glycosyltransferase involved in cell wall biosynthesis
MPKVLRIINRFNIGGPTYNAAYLSKYLSTNYETLLIGGMKDESEDSSEYIVDKLGLIPGVLPEMKREINFFNDRAAYRKICQIIDDFKPDIVHTHASKPGFLGRLAAHRKRVPVILHTFHGHVFHSYFNPIKTNVYKTLERKLAEVSTKIIAISDIQKHELSSIHKICPPEKIEVVPLGFDLSRFNENIEEKRAWFRKKYDVKDDEIAISIVGRLVPIKNHSMFLQAMKSVLEKTSKKVRAFIVGDGEDCQKLLAESRALGLNTSYFPDNSVSSTITFTSWIKQVDYVLAGSDIIALTSKNEGTPVSLIEAQAANRPIVTTKVGGIENVVIPGRTALLAEPDDLETFAKNLLHLIENESEAKAMAKDGWAFVGEKFHYNRLVSDIEKLYDRLLSQRESEKKSASFQLST